MRVARHTAHTSGREEDSWHAESTVANIISEASIILARSTFVAAAALCTACSIRWEASDLISRNVSVSTPPYSPPSATRSRIAARPSRFRSGLSNLPKFTGQPDGIPTSCCGKTSSMQNREHSATTFTRRITNCLIAAAAIVVLPLSVVAQVPEVLTSPPNIVVPNYEGIPVGPFAGLEASAYVARTNDPSAAWFNPAGLALAKGAQISGSAGLYQYTKLSPALSPGAGSSIQHVPNLVGFTLQTGHKLTLGAAILTPVDWSQNTNLEVIQPSGTNLERMAYSANSEFSRRVIALSAGYDSQKKWRFGGGLTFLYTSLEMRQTISDRIAEPTGLRTLIVSSVVTGSDLKLGSVFGVQVDPHPHIRIGGVFRTSGLSIHRSGTATLDGTDKNGSASNGASFFDPEAQFHYKLPFEGTGAIAWVGNRGEVEAV